MLSSNVLVLNKSFLPVHITSLKRALILLYQGVAKAVDENYRTFAFDSWKDISVLDKTQSVGLVNKFIRVPRVILLINYDKVPKRYIKFSRANIFLRDKNKCQYCGKEFKKNDLNLDHVIPRAYGGISSWENIVCSCIKCNRIKGGRTPEEAGMKLMRKPKKPEWSPYYHISLTNILYKEWMPFLNLVDNTYWHIELEE
ncbi:MAG: HNH endonuclease [Candidatus Acididesulfobacter diazotrophicus]|jgi:5-methylcytosine-specific restriction endonuclease McrA|uniref:HNH endonuclease n=1 Tax=Candidatus Acididesulfobacter diazotrophicus TaxID=2597226 RepID=A0A519BNL3_9DELT|nr:MAG: HNH endonuclease [Candidatus Acididesulfobacter diazotrophicus]